MRIHSFCLAIEPCFLRSIKFLDILKIAEINQSMEELGSSSRVVENNGFEVNERDLESDETLWALYERWKIHHGIFRYSEDMQKSFDTFKKNAMYVHKVNQDKLSQSKVGLNKLGDVSDEEFRRFYIMHPDGTYGIYPAGGYAPVEDLKKVEGIGEFAVKEHNKQAQTHLKFEQVVKGESQIVAGTNFNLILRASIEEQVYTYNAYVFKRLPCRNGGLKLISFEAIDEED
ncbi:hypothetical protein Scep_020883 [Stephania cephalantha]|uniref:Cathepsin propeptide inhibitor domain-containing protein n=1 Tax=Stephania cephalantha TaxID=152367 RepID=A0AAP0I1D7_9MAGN